MVLTSSSRASAALSLVTLANAGVHERAFPRGLRVRNVVRGRRWWQAGSVHGLIGGHPRVAASTLLDPWMMAASRAPARQGRRNDGGRRCLCCSGAMTLPSRCDMASSAPCGTTGLRRSGGPRRRRAESRLGYERASVGDGSTARTRTSRISGSAPSELGSSSPSTHRLATATCRSTSGRPR